MSSALLIRVEDGSAEGKEFNIDDVLTIGRGNNNDLVLTEPTVSRQHARIVRRQSNIVIEDLDSAHGTIVTGETINTRELKPGDTIEIGPVELSVVGDETGDSQSSANIEHVENTSAPSDATSLSPSLAGATTDSNESAERFEHLLDLSMSLQKEHETGKLLNKIASHLIDTMSVDRCGVFLRNESGPRIVYTGDNDVPSDQPFSSTLVERAMERGDAMVINDTGRQDRIDSPSLSAGDVKSVMISPLWGREKILGAIVTENHGETDVFGKPDLRFLIALANLAGMSLENTKLIENIQEETMERVVLSRFLSPAVAEEVRNTGIEEGLPGERKEITVLFTDIRGFTSMSEKLPPDELLTALNQSFEVMVDAILDQDGTVDKFTGDGILSFFGAPLDQPDHPQRALRTARKISKQTEGLTTQSGAPIKIGISLATGKATVGSVGPSERREYTAIGDVVNVAARLVGRAKAGQILSTESFTEKINGISPQELGRMDLKGKSSDVPVFEVPLDE